VLLDIGLPRMNGYQAVRPIREKTGGKQMSSSRSRLGGQEDDIRKALEAGFHHHLTKPVDPAIVEKLISTIAQASPNKLKDESNRHGRRLSSGAAWMNHSGWHGGCTSHYLEVHHE
jgi:DNA-binding response OmpR family regulator